MLLVGGAVSVAACNAIWGVDQLSYGVLVGAGGGAAQGGVGGLILEGGSGGHGAGAQAGGGQGGGQQGGAGGGAATGGAGGTGPPPECSPGATQNVGGCPKCGTLVQTCDPNGFWQAAVCQNQGDCTTGDTRAASCDQCSQEVCNGSCHWGACQLKPGSECEWQQGTHFLWCNSQHTWWQFCLPQCVWADCAPR
jgi:hypothetical protein